MSRYIDADAFEREMYHESFEKILKKQETADVVPKWKYDRLLENAKILAEAVKKNQEKEV